MKRFVHVCISISSNMLCCTVFFFLHMKISGFVMMKIKIIIFKLIIIDLFTQGSFVAQPNHFCYNAATTLLWFADLASRIWMLRKGNLIIIFGEWWNRQDNTLWSYQKYKTWRNILFYLNIGRKAWKEKWIETILD